MSACPVYRRFNEGGYSLALRVNASIDVVKARPLDYTTGIISTLQVSLFYDTKSGDQSAYVGRSTAEGDLGRTMLDALKLGII